MKLNPTKVEEIKILISQGVTQPKIAEQFSVSRSLISDIATGRVWKQVGGPVKDSTNKRVLNLESEVVMLRDERNIMKRQIKTMFKTHGLFQSLVEEMESCVKPYTALPSVFDLEAKSEIEEHLVMHLSDGHHDQVIKPVECGGLEDHDFRVSCRRAEVYVDKVLKWSQQTLAPTFKFPILTILAYGDFTSGEIHGNMERSYYRNQFKNCFAIGQLHALMFRDLAVYFDMINVVYVPGNHGRRSIKKNFNGPHDNWDYLIAEMARLHCRDIDNLNFVIPDTFTINVDIGGVGFCVTHGDDVRSNLGIPWYGLARRQQRITALNHLQSGPRIKYFCCGHFHRPGAISELDCEILVNGSWIATDAYSYNSFSGFSEPTQLLHGVYPRYGISWRLPVNLRTPDEKKGPRRYKIDLMNEVGV